MLPPTDPDKKRHPLALVMSGDGSTLFGNDRYGSLYRSEGDKPFVPFGPQVDSCAKEMQTTALALSPDDTILAVGMLGGIRLYDARTGTLLRVLEHGACAITISFSPNGQYLSAGIPGSFTGVLRSAACRCGR
jgi:WD40 repeat protein